MADIIMQSDGFRAVDDQKRQRVVIEKRVLDALGESSWQTVAEFTRAASSPNIVGGTDALREALYNIFTAVTEALKAK